MQDLRGRKHSGRLRRRTAWCYRTPPRCRRGDSSGACRSKGLAASSHEHPQPRPPRSTAPITIIRGAGSSGSPPRLPRGGPAAPGALRCPPRCRPLPRAPARPYEDRTVPSLHGLGVMRRTTTDRASCLVARGGNRPSACSRPSSARSSQRGVTGAPAAAKRAGAPASVGCTPAAGHLLPRGCRPLRARSRWSRCSVMRAVAITGDTYGHVSRAFVGRRWLGSSDVLS